MDLPVQDRVVAVVAKQFGLRESEINRETRFREDLGADSLDVIELAMEFTEEFDISIPDEDAEKLLTVGNAIDYIAKKVPAAELVSK